MSDWESEDFDPDKGFEAPGSADKWEGEDEDDVKENWLESEDEEKKPDQVSDIKSQQKKKKKKDIIAEKEAKEREARLRKLEERKPMTAEEKLADKLEKQRLQEESDLRVARETFGLTMDSISVMEKDDFDMFGKMVKDKLSEAYKSAHYVPFLEDLMKDLSANLDADDVKKLSTAINTLLNEKLKQRAAKGAKKKKTKSLKMERPGEYVLEDDLGREYDDFL